MALTEATIRKTVAAYFLAVRQRDREAWVGTFEADAVDYDPADTFAPIKGHDSLRSFFDGFLAKLRSLTLEENHVFVVGNQAAVKWSGRGVTKSGKAVTAEGIDVFTLSEAGRIQEMRAYWDMVGFLKKAEA